MGSGGRPIKNRVPLVEMSNRSLRNSRRRRFARRYQRGGSPQAAPAFGNGIYDALAGAFGGASTTGAGSGPPVPIEARAPVVPDSCAYVPRPGELVNQPVPELAQNNAYPFAGSSVIQPPFTAVPTPPPTASAVAFSPISYNLSQQGGRRTHRHRRGGGGPCPICNGRKKQRGGGCPCMARSNQSGGGSPQGVNLYPTTALSGGGPNVGNGLYLQTGCDAPAGISDVRGGNNAAEGGGPMGPSMPAVAAAAVPAVTPGPTLYNAQGILQQVGGRRRKQRGGSAMNLAPAPLDNAFPNTPQPSYGAANAFPESCYKAPGSEIPVYNNNSASFNFSPSITENNTLPPGVNVYNDVIQQPGRMGPPEPAATALQGIPASSQVSTQRGGRRSRRNRKANRKVNRKNSRKNNRVY
jgi:hypothetical protein